MLWREPWRLLFPLGTLLAWLGVLPWLFFALRLRGAYEPFYGTLGYRSFFHPLAEMEGFLTCFAVGLLFTLLPRRTGTSPAARWQVVFAVLAPIASAVLGATGHWKLGQVASLLLLAVALEFSFRRLPRPLSPAVLWIGFGLLMGAAGAVLAEVAAQHGDDWFWLHELGRDLVMQGLFSGFALGIGRMLRGDPPATRRSWALHALGGAAFVASFWIGARSGQHLGFALRGLIAALVARPLVPEWEFGPRNLRRGLAHLALWLLAAGNVWVAIALSVRRAGLHVIFLGGFAALLLAAFTETRGGARLLALTTALLALSMMARAMVELDPTSFRLWMGISSGAFLAGTLSCAALSRRLA